MKNYKFVKRICDNGQQRAALLNDDSKFVIQTEQYIKKAGLSKGLLSIRKNSEFMEAYVKKTARNGKFYFNLKSLGNHTTIAGPSKMYKTEEERQIAIDQMIVSANMADEVTKIGWFSKTFESAYKNDIVPEDQL